MALYGILKKYIGEWLDIFVILMIGILYYFGLLKVEVLYSIIKTLCFFYLYKIYQIIFVRIYDNSKKYKFSLYLYRIFSKEFLIRYKGFIYILFIIMPGNLFGYILITMVVMNKLLKIGFNGVKDFFFFIIFKYNIRPVFEEYIIWYYDNIDKYVRIFVHEPFLRMIMVPTIIRNSIIKSSFFSLLKARMFTFFFLSILVSTGVYEYLHQPWYVCIIIIYIYFLVIWPMIIRILNIKNIYYNGTTLMAYATPSTVFAAFIIVRDSSVSLSCLMQFLIYINDESNILIFYNGIFPRWYTCLLNKDIMDKEGLFNYAEVDRKFAAIMFWRYEKTYTSFICFYTIVTSPCVIDSLKYYNALHEGFYGRHISEEEAEKMEESFKLYINICFLFIHSSIKFINPKIKFIVGLYLFHRDEKINIIIKENYKGINCENLILEFYNMKQLLINVSYMEVLPIDFGLRRYIRMLKCASFFDISAKFYFSNMNVYKVILGLYFYRLHFQTIVKEKGGRVKCSKHGKSLHESNIEFKIDKNGIYQHEVDGFNSMFDEYEKLCKEKGRDFILNKEYIDKLTKKDK